MQLDPRFLSKNDIYFDYIYQRHWLVNFGCNTCKKGGQTRVFGCGTFRFKQKALNSPNSHSITRIACSVKSEVRTPQPI